MKNIAFRYGIIFYVLLIISMSACGEDDPNHILNINIEDENLRDCIIGYAEATGYWHTDLTFTITCDDEDIVSLIGLEHFDQVGVLSLGFNDIEDIAPLAGMDSLRSVSLGVNPRLTELEPLFELENLIFVYLVGSDNVACSDLEMLAEKASTEPREAVPGRNCQER